MDQSDARNHMVDSQLRPNRITEPRLLAAMRTVPREQYLPRSLRGVAYADDDLGLPGGGHLIEPLALARLIQLAEIAESHVVLVIGCSTGYAGAVIAQLAATVIVLQPDTTHAEHLEQLFDDQNVDNVVAVVGDDPAAGHRSQAPYDVILLVGSVPGAPSQLLDQIDDGGRLVAVVEDGRVGKGTLYTQMHGVVAHRVAFDAQIPRVPGWADVVEFVF